MATKKKTTKKTAGSKASARPARARTKSIETKAKAQPSGAVECIDEEDERSEGGAVESIDRLRKRALPRITEAGKRRLIQGLIARLSDRMESPEDGMKASLSDLIRLLQLERELTPERPRKITVEWVEPELRAS